MEQLLEFAGDNLLLSGAFVVVLLILIATEINRATRKFRELSTQEAIQRMNREDVVILDVSGSADFGKGHILGAVNMPPSRIESGNQELVKWKDRPILICCKNGQVSPQMAGRLTGMGFTDVAVLRGGLAQWKADNQPVTTDAKPAAKGKSGKDAEGEGKKSRKRRRKNKGRGKDKSAGSGQESGESDSAEPAETGTESDTESEPQVEPESESNPSSNGTKIHE